MIDKELYRRIEKYVEPWLARIREKACDIIDKPLAVYDVKNFEIKDNEGNVLMHRGKGKLKIYGWEEEDADNNC